MKKFVFLAGCLALLPTISMADVNLAQSKACMACHARFVRTALTLACPAPRVSHGHDR